uniref:Uncharacterized protein n=1 Tax=Cacopsylla melanoneura TaxID=428564 RepID=A0A8D8TZK3_9HEMI
MLGYSSHLTWCPFYQMLLVEKLSWYCLYLVSTLHDLGVYPFLTLTMATVGAMFSYSLKVFFLVSGQFFSHLMVFFPVCGRFLSPLMLFFLVSGQGLKSLH